MNKTFNNILIFLSGMAILLVMAISCTGRKEKAERSGLIPEEDFIDILADIHIADGLLILPQIRNLYEQSDSVQNYNDVISRHGYTKAEMDKTIRYYFVKKPRRLVRIYDEVLAKLSEMEAVYAKEDVTGEANYWQGDTLYYMPGGSDTLLFSHQFKSFGYYTLNFTLTLFPDDQTANPRFVAYFCHPDSVETGKRDYYPTFRFIKDGRPHNYSFFRKPSSPHYTYLKGWFIYPGDNITNAQRHLMIDNIRLNFLPAAR